MKYLKFIISVVLILTLSCPQFSYAAFDVKGVQLFRDGNVCINKPSSGVLVKEALNLANLQSNSESIQSRISSGGSLCSPTPFFTGGALLTTKDGITIQAEPNVQGLGRGILISEIAGNTSGISSSGEPNAFNNLTNTFGGESKTLFEITLPTGCDVVDDDDDVIGASTNLAGINDFSFHTCTSTNGLTINCNDTETALYSAKLGLVPSSGSTPAKIRFQIDSYSNTDLNMIDTILIKLDSQDIFCPGTTMDSLLATIVAKNEINNPTKSQTIGTAELGNPTSQVVKFSYAKDKATSQKGEISENEVGTTPILINNSSTFANTIQIEELHEESIPIGGLSSSVLINPSQQVNAEINIINLWLVPSITSLFLTTPQISDISFSDSSFVVDSSPYLVMSNSDDSNAPFGTLVIPLRKNTQGVDPSGVKTIITIKNIGLGIVLGDIKDPTVSLTIFEPVSGGAVNVPGVVSIFNTGNLANPQNFSAFAVNSSRGSAQNAIADITVSAPQGANQVTSDTDLAALTQRNAVLGAPQIKELIKVVSAVTTPDANKITLSSANDIDDSTLLIVTAQGASGATTGGAKVKVESFPGKSKIPFDLVTVISKSDGSFSAKVKSDTLNSDTTIVIKQVISGKESSEVKITSSASTSILLCTEELCTCPSQTCIPTVQDVLTYIKDNGGLANIILQGGFKFSEVVEGSKKALGLN